MVVAGATARRGVADPIALIGVVAFWFVGCDESFDLVATLNHDLEASGQGPGLSEALALHFACGNRIELCEREVLAFFEV